jgi:hypothetical protein
MNAYTTIEGWGPFIFNLELSVHGKIPWYQLNRTLQDFRARKCEEIISIVPKLRGQIIIASQ